MATVCLLYHQYAARWHNKAKISFFSLLDGWWLAASPATASHVQRALSSTAHARMSWQRKDLEKKKSLEAYHTSRSVFSQWLSSHNAHTVNDPCRKLMMPHHCRGNICIVSKSTVAYVLYWIANEIVSNVGVVDQSVLGLYLSRSLSPQQKLDEELPVKLCRKQNTHTDTFNSQIALARQNARPIKPAA